MSDATAEASEDASAAALRSAMRWVWCCAGLAALPALVAAVVSVGADWTPAADYGPIEVKVRDVFSVHPPMLGPYSRVGGNHPGPALFYALAVPYRILGSQPWALLVSASVLNAGWAALAVRLVGRRGRVGLAAGLAALILACTWGLGVDHVRDPWNPHIPVFAFLLAVVAAWAVTGGSRWSLPIALVSASFSLQTHVGYIVLAAVLVLWCLVGMWWHRSDWRSWRAPVVVSLVMVALMWAPVLYQQLFGSGPGNLFAIIGAARDTGEPRWGLRGINDYLLPHLGPTPAWFRSKPSDLLQLGGRRGLTWPPLGLLAFAAGSVVAVRRRDREPLVLLSVTATLWVAGAFSITQLSGLASSYLYRWVRVLGILLWLSALWPLGRAALGAVRRRLPSDQALTASAGLRWGAGPVGRRVLASAVTAVLAVAVSAGETATPFAQFQREFSQSGLAAERTVAEVQDRAAPGSDVEVRFLSSVSFNVASVVAGLERAGYRTFVEHGSGTVWGGHRQPGRTSPDLVVLVTDEDPSAARAANPDMRLVTTVDLLVPEERREYEALEPSASRCVELNFAAFTGTGGRATTAEADSCRRRHELVRNDRALSVLIGTGPR